MADDQEPLIGGSQELRKIGGYLSPFWRKIAKRQWDADGLIKCALCPDVWPVTLEHNLELDHIVPQSRGGKTTLENCWLVCPTCNKIKGNNPRQHEWERDCRKAWERRMAARQQTEGLLPDD